MKIGDITKLTIAVLVVLVITFFITIGACSSEVGLPILAAIAGYVFGNGTKVVIDKINTNK